METTFAQTEMLHDVKDFHWFAFAAVLGLFINNQINVHIGVDEISIGASFNCSFYSHQTMFLKYKMITLYHLIIKYRIDDQNAIETENHPTIRPKKQAPFRYI